MVYFLLWTLISVYVPLLSLFLEGSLGGLPNEQDILPEAAILDGPSIQSPHIVICAIVLDEHLYIQEWVEYHAYVIGFEHIYLYDNSVDYNARYLGILYPDLVTVTHFPGAHMQLAAYHHFLNATQSDIWAAFIDVDEFIAINSPKVFSVKDLVAVYGGNGGAICLNWVLFGSNEHTAYSSDLVTRRFVSRMVDVDKHVKCIVHVNDVIYFSNPHYAHLVPGKYQWDMGHSPFIGEFNSMRDESVASVQHYFTKSFSEFTRKRLRGRSDVPEGQWYGPTDFHRYGVNTAAVATRKDTALAERMLDWQQRKVAQHVASRYGTHCATLLEGNKKSNDKNSHGNGNDSVNSESAVLREQLAFMGKYDRYRFDALDAVGITCDLLIVTPVMLSNHTEVHFFLGAEEAPMAHLVLAEFCLMHRIMGSGLCDELVHRVMQGANKAIADRVGVCEPLELPTTAVIQCKVQRLLRLLSPGLTPTESSIGSTNQTRSLRLLQTTALGCQRLHSNELSAVCFDAPNRSSFSLVTIYVINVAKADAMQRLQQEHEEMEDAGMGDTDNFCSLRIRSVAVRETEFLYSLAYHDFLAFPPQWWGSSSYVGVISSQAMDGVHYGLCDFELRRMVYLIDAGDFEVVPLLRTGYSLLQRGVMLHSTRFEHAWDALLGALGYTPVEIRQQDGVLVFVHHAMLLQPVWLRRLSSFMLAAMDKVIHNATLFSMLREDVLDDEWQCTSHLATIEGAVTVTRAGQQGAESCYQIPLYAGQSPPPVLLSVVFEMLPTFFFAAEGASVCSITESCFVNTA